MRFESLDYWRDQLRSEWLARQYADERSSLKRRHSHFFYDSDGVIELSDDTEDDSEYDTEDDMEEPDHEEPVLKRMKRIFKREEKEPVAYPTKPRQSSSRVHHGQPQRLTIKMPSRTRRAIKETPENPFDIERLTSATYTERTAEVGRPIAELQEHSSAIGTGPSTNNTKTTSDTNHPSEGKTPEHPHGIEAISNTSGTENTKEADFPTEVVQQLSSGIETISSTLKPDDPIKGKMS